MKFFLFFFIFLLYHFSNVAAQEPSYFVEIGAYAEPVKMDYFQKMANVYETVDANWIYRYRIDVTNKSEGEQTLKNAKTAGFNYARLVDVDFSRACCSSQCGYVPPIRTDARHLPINNPKAKNDYDIVSGGRILLDGGKKKKKGDIYTDPNSAKTLGNETVVDNNTKPNKNKDKKTDIIYRQDVKKTLDSLENIKKANPQTDKNSDIANPQTDKNAAKNSKNSDISNPQTDKNTSEPAARPKKKRRQIYNKDTDKMEDI